MKISEAIKILNKLEKTLAPTMAANGTDAIKLGIEALIRIRYQRIKPTVPHKTLLPSETED